MLSAIIYVIFIIMSPGDFWLKRIYNNMIMDIYFNNLKWKKSTSSNVE